MKQAIHMIVTLAGIGIIAGGLLAVVNIWAVPHIAENKKAETERAIFLVQPEGKSYEKIVESGLDLYKVFNNDKQPIGYSFAFDGNGFQGNIRLMAGLSMDLNTVMALEILEQVETPGLGTKVTETPFTKQFHNLSTRPEINWVKGEPPSNPNEIQAVTGATISSKAVVAILNAGIAKLDELKKKGVAL